MAAGQDPSRFWDKTLRLIFTILKGCQERVHTLFLSMEGLFHSEDVAGRSALAELLDGCDTKLLFIVRSQETWLASRYYESVTKGFFREERDFDQFVSDTIEAGKLDYSKIVNELAQTFNAEPILWSYETLPPVGGAVEQVVELLDLRDHLPVKVPEEYGNVSKPVPELIEAHRQLNQFSHNLRGVAYRDWCKRMQAYGLKLRAERNVRYGHALMEKATAKKLLDAVHNSNRSLANQYLQGGDFGPQELKSFTAPKPLDTLLISDLVTGGQDMLLREASKIGNELRLLTAELQREKELRFKADIETIGGFLRDSNLENESRLANQTLSQVKQQRDQLHAELQRIKNRRAWRLVRVWDKAKALVKKPKVKGQTASEKRNGKPAASKPGTLTFKPTNIRKPVSSDVCIVTTCRFPGGNASSTLDEIRVFKEAGLTVSIIHCSANGGANQISSRYEKYITDIVHSDDVVSIEAGLLIVRAPRVIMSPRFQALVNNVNANRAIFVVNNSAWRPDGEPVFDWNELLQTVHNFGFENRKVYPLGPAIRAEAVKHSTAFENLIADDDWLPTCDATKIVFNPRHVMMSPFVVGRHGRDGPEKWHESKKALAGAFPNSSAFKIYILGGAEKAAKSLGGIPDNWVVYPYGAMDVAVFLQRLDVFVYFPHSDLNEAFGRTIMEAMFAGVPCVLPYRFAETFGETALYCNPEDVRSVVDRLAENDKVRSEFVTAVRSRMIALHDSTALLNRVPEFGFAVPPLGGLPNLDEHLLKFKRWVETGVHQ